MHHPSAHSGSSTTCSRRGVAMMLVLVGLMCATVLTTAYLVSRDNSAVIGENVSQAASARWGATSGLHMGMAVLETEANWRLNHSNGWIMSNYAVADADVGILLEDIETGDEPRSNTTYVRMLSRANTSGLEHEASAIVTVPVRGSVDVGLSEFAVFSGGEITLVDQAMVTRWPNARLSRLERPLSIATRSTDFSVISIGANAAILDAVAWLPPGANSYGVSNSSTLDVDAVIMDDAIAFPAAPDPTAAPPDPDGAHPDADLEDFSLTLSGEIRLNSMSLNRNGLLNYEGGGVFVIDDRLRLRRNSTMRVSGNATLIVYGDLVMEEGARLLLESGATLRLFVGGDLLMDSGFIGEVGGTINVVNGGEWIDVSRIQIFSIEGDDQLDWRMVNQSLVKASIYAPDAAVRIRDQSILCGRIAAAELYMRNEARIFYDHALDRRLGYTNPDSPLYTSTGRIRSAYLDLERFDDAELQVLANQQQVQLLALRRTYGTAPEADVDVAEDEPTPRTVRLTQNMLSFDTSTPGWEQ